MTGFRGTKRNGEGPLGQATARIITTISSKGTGKRDYNNPEIQVSGEMSGHCWMSRGNISLLPREPVPRAVYNMTADFPQRKQLRE